MGVAWLGGGRGCCMEEGQLQQRRGWLQHGPGGQTGRVLPEGGKKPTCWVTWAELCQLTALRKGTKRPRYYALFLERERVHGKTWRKVGNEKMVSSLTLGLTPSWPHRREGTACRKEIA